MHRCKDRSWIMFTEIQMLSSEVQTTCVIIQIQWSKPKMIQFADTDCVSTRTLSTVSSG
ncbi:unnamed protein product [Prunus brigantina]